MRCRRIRTHYVLCRFKTIRLYGEVIFAEQFLNISLAAHPPFDSYQRCNLIDLMAFHSVIRSAVRAS